MKVCVIGGGAAGMMAAIKIAEKKHEVHLFEKNEKLGKKLYITGKGRCNVTNAVTGPEFLNNVVSNPKFVMSSEVRFNSTDTREFFESLGVSLKIERGNRVFPQSDRSSDIISALSKRMKQLKVNVNLSSKVDNILVNEDGVCGIELKNKELSFDAVIVATGGISYKSTGSTGDGYTWAEKTGHRVISPVQALVPIVLNNEKEFKNLEGLSLKNVTLLAKLNTKEIFKSDIGEMLFTSDGISGPLVLTLSSYINRYDISKIKLFIDFKPALSSDALKLRIDRDIVSLKSKQVTSLMQGLLPKALVPIFLKRLNIAASTKANQLSSKQREEIISMLKGFEMMPKQLASFDYAVVTAGGVSVKDISPKSMESKLVKNLYFIGEVLDIDALTGGFNLQLAFSTAVSCASNF